MARIVAVTAGQDGVTTPFLAAESLRQAGEALGHGMQVEAQSTVGTHGPLSDDAIRAADAVIIAADGPLDQARFAGKRVLVVGTRAAISDPRAVLLDVLGEALAPAPKPEPAAAPAAA